MTRRAYTLIEIMVVMALLALMSGIIGIKMNGAIQKKRFNSDIERLKSRIELSQKLATANEEDWSSILKKEKKGWVLESSSEEGKKLTPLHIGPMEVQFKGKKVEGLALEFFANGYTYPKGAIFFIRDDQKAKIALSE